LNVTAYPEINALLGEWVQGLLHVLGGNVIGLYLSGSLGYGDFVPDRSDIDLQAVLRVALTSAELRTVELLHRDLERRYPAWADRIECSYVPLELMHELMPPKSPRPWWGFGTLYPEAPAGNEWIINHYLLSRHGVALTGPDFNELLPTIDIDEVRRASAKDLFEEWLPKIDDADWLANSHYQSYLVLNLCRILHTVIEGEPRSKKIAAGWAKAAYPQWRDLIEESEKWTYGTEMKRQGETIRFLRFAANKVDESRVLG
jgi:hypothetical protein